MGELSVRILTRPLASWMGLEHVTSLIGKRSAAWRRGVWGARGAGIRAPRASGLFLAPPLTEGRLACVDNAERAVPPDPYVEP